jgi:predicted nucleic acid-binding protein
MGKRFLIDSNVLIDYTAARLPQKGSDFVEDVFNTDFLISVAVKIEVLGFNDAPSKMAGMELFLNTATVLPLDEAITKQTIELRRQYKKLKLGDAIIAATALVYNLTLITRNTSDFKNIIGIKVINLFERY